MPYSGARKRLLKGAFLMKEVETLPISAFEDLGYVHQAGGEWPREHCLRYYGYPIQQKHHLMDAVATAQTDSIALFPKKAAVSSEGSLVQQEADLHKR